MSTSDIFIGILVFMYVIVAVLAFLSYLMGPPDGPYANAKTVLYSFLWPVMLVTIQLWRFVRWVTRP